MRSMRFAVLFAAASGGLAASVGGSTGARAEPQPATVAPGAVIAPDAAACRPVRRIVHHRIVRRVRPPVVAVAAVPVVPLYPVVPVRPYVVYRPPVLVVRRPVVVPVRPVVPYYPAPVF